MNSLMSITDTEIHDRCSKIVVNYVLPCAYIYRFHQQVVNIVFDAAAPIHLIRQLKHVQVALQMILLVRHKRTFSSIIYIIL